MLKLNRKRVTDKRSIPKDRLYILYLRVNCDSIKNSMQKHTTKVSGNKKHIHNHSQINIRLAKKKQQTKLQQTKTI